MRTASLLVQRTVLVTRLNSVHRAIEYIESQYFKPHPIRGNVAFKDRIPKRTASPEVLETMRSRLGKLREQQAALLAELETLDEHIPEHWFQR